MPERYPPYQTCHRRYQSWGKSGVFKKILLHHLRLHLLKQRFGKDIVKTYLSELLETKLTIVILTTSVYDDDLELNLLLPISEIVNVKQLKMAELFAATKKRWKVERFFSWLQSFRRVKTRYEYHAENYLGMVQIASIKIILRYL